jgi:hypothetical protein
LFGISCMRNIRDLLPKRQHIKAPVLLDEKTIFYIAKKVLVEEYGIRGGENIIPSLYQDKKLFLSSRSSLWGNEVWLEKERLRDKMNTWLGTEGILEIKVDRG